MNANILVLLRFCLKRDITSLYKSFLDELTHLHQDQVDAIAKIESLIPREYHEVIHALDILDQNKISYLRKKILDSGNNSVRHTQELLDKVNQFDGGSERPY